MVEVRQASLWRRIYEDDTEICNEPKERLEESLEWWRYALGRRGRTVSTSKTEWMCVSIGERGER